MEAEILTEIRDSEKKADEIIEKAKREKESIIHDANLNSSKLLLSKQEEIKKLQEKKIMDFREKTKSVKEEKLAEGKNIIKQIKAKAEKNIPKTIEYIIKKFEGMV